MLSFKTFIILFLFLNALQIKSMHTILVSDEQSGTREQMHGWKHWEEETRAKDYDSIGGM